MGEKIFYWLALNIIAGFWFVYSKIEFRRWRKRRTVENCDRLFTRITYLYIVSFITFVGNALEVGEVTRRLAKFFQDYLIATLNNSTLDALHNVSTKLLV
jgi:hypothetical protein